MLAILGLLVWMLLVIGNQLAVNRACADDSRK